MAKVILEFFLCGSEQTDKEGGYSTIIGHRRNNIGATQTNKLMYKGNNFETAKVVQSRNLLLIWTCPTDFTRQMRYPRLPVHVQNISCSS
jgi:hypothetical protein